MDDLYQRRKKRWLSYGRALMTLGILGLITVFLVIVTKSNNRDEHSSRIIVVNEEKFVHRSEIFDGSKEDESHVEKQRESRVKRSVDNEVPKNSVDSDERANEVSKLIRQDPSSNFEDRRHYGEVYYFKGFKCHPHVPIRKLLEFKRPREHWSGMCCVCDAFEVGCIQKLSQTFFISKFLNLIVL